MTKRQPVIIELDEEDLDRSGPDHPSNSAPILDLEQDTSLQMVTRVSARKPSWLWRAVRWSGGLLLAIFITSWGWDIASQLIARNEVLGWITLGLIAVLLASIGLLALREFATLIRMRRMDGFQKQFHAIENSPDAAREFYSDLERFYNGREHVKWDGSQTSNELDQYVDVEPIITITENQMLAPLDAQAQIEIASAARQVTTGTAIIPLPLADVAIALIVNLRMIRRISEIYGGRAGSLGSWRLMRAVAAHLVATGAVAIGDDLLGSIAGGTVLSKLSRRFGEGIVNGALTTRVGIAAIEISRPMPFGNGKKPSVTGLMKTALKGFFTS